MDDRQQNFIKLGTQDAQRPTLERGIGFNSSTGMLQ